MAFESKHTTNIISSLSKKFWTFIRNKNDATIQKVTHPYITPKWHPHASHQKGTPTWHAHTLHPSAVREMGFRKRSLTKNPFSSFRSFFSSLFHPTFSFSLCLLVSTSLCLNCYPLSLLVSAILSCFKIDLYLTTPCLPISNLHILFYTFFSTPHLTPNILSILNH